jgi:photosystem II stability/assembly factor-like uncharacterized protein
MARKILIGTNEGLILGDGEDWVELERFLTGRKITSVIAREGVILAGTPDGVLRSDDGGGNWREVNVGLTNRHVRWLAYHPAVSDLEFAGTEPAGIFVSKDGAETWEEKPEVASNRDKFNWFLPYSPESGCVRGFAFHGDRIYAAVEVGGILISNDRGESWQLAGGSDGNPRFGQPETGFIHPDVHSVAVHPSSSDLVFAPTGGGFYISIDGGLSWKLGHPPCYCRAVWVDPEDSKHIILGPADSVSRNGRIVQTIDGGDNWEPLKDGLKTPWPHHMVERFVMVRENLLSVLSNGQLIIASSRDWRWRKIFEEAGFVNCVTEISN